MAGGKGTRLRPLTTTRPKPMIPVANRPIMEHVVALLKRCGIKESVATLYYLPSLIRSHFGDGSRFGIRIEYSEEDVPLGTAGGVKRVEGLLEDTFVVISGDVLTDINIRDAIRFHEGVGALATIILTRVPNPLNFGIVELDRSGRVRRFLEKPSWEEVFTDTINAGIYVLEPEVLKYVREKEASDFGRDLFPILLRKGLPLYGYVAPGYWNDIGNIAQYLQANYDVMTGKVGARVPGRLMRRSVWVDEGYEGGRGVDLVPPVVIGKNCQIGRNSQIGPFTILGDDVKVGEGARVKRSIVMDEAFLGAMSELSGCIIGTFCKIESNAVILEGATIADGCIVGQRAVVKPRVRVWPEKWIEPGTTLGDDLRWGIRWPRTLFGNWGITGTVNVEITPEFAAKIGVTVGTYLGRGATVVIGRDTHAVSRMIKRAVTSGLVSAGVNVHNLRVAPTPIVRYATRKLRANGGIAVRIRDDDPNAATIELFDSNGVNVSRRGEGRLEDIFFKGDFRRAHIGSMGHMTYPEVFSSYKKELIGLVDEGRTKEARLTVVVDCGGGTASLIAPSVLNHLGCEVTALNTEINEFATPFTFDEAPLSLARLAKEVRSVGGDLGIAFSADCSRVLFVDERGGRVPNDVMLSFLTRQFLIKKGGGSIVVPVSASEAVDVIAKRHGGKVIRSKIGARALLKAMVDEDAIFGGDEGGGYVVPDLQIGFDGIASSLSVIESVATSGKALSGLLGDIPRFYMAKQRVMCPLSLRGRVMRQVMQENMEQQVSTIDGVKLFFDHSWVLILTDRVEPFFWLYAEAPTEAEAKNLIETYAKRIKELAAE